MKQTKVMRCALSKTLIAVALTLSGVTVSHARKTDFREAHTGMLMGAGTYYHWLVNDNFFDPFPGAASDADTVTGSKNTFLLPVRFGFFKDSAVGNFSVYGVYMINLKSAWTVSGNSNGSGTSTFTGKGVGAEASLPLYQDTHVRLNFAANAEYLWQSVVLRYTTTADETQRLKLHTRSLLAGVGLAPELWLGDQYSLSLFAGYQYGFPRLWNVSQNATFMGNDYATGVLQNPTSGGNVRVNFGGFYFSAALKLNFQ